MAKVISAQAAAQLIKDGDTVASAGMGIMGLCEEVIRATEQLFLETGHPKELNLFYGAHQGDNPIVKYGWDHWAHEGMLKRWTGGFLGASPKIGEMCRENKIEGYCLPMGVIDLMYHEIAGHTPGLITKIGLKTYVDPRLEGAKVNEAAKEDIVKLIELEGEEWLFYKNPGLNVGLIRGTTADADGNLTISEECINGDALAVAQAVKNSGGIVIAQAKYLAAAGSLHPRDIHIPGVLVDYVVVSDPASDTHYQTVDVFYDPTLCGNVKAEMSAMPSLALKDSKVIARRAAMEMDMGTCVNLGIGIPQMIALVAVEEGVNDCFTLTSESGIIGGIAVQGKNFGSCYNPACFLDQDVQLNWYSGGGLGTAFLGLAETDQRGNVNVSKFGTRLNGPGGFIDITQPTKKVVFCGSFTAGKLQTEIRDKKLVIVQEGRSHKFMDKVQQVTFSGEYAVESGQEVLYITERGVFRLTGQGMELIEIAPGVDLEADILAQMDFKPLISPDLKEMDSFLFEENWGGLREYLEKKTL